MAIVSNGVTALHRENLLKMYNGELLTPDNVNFSHIALGSGNNPFSESDTLLQTEEFRKQITQKTRLSNRTRSIVSILENEANNFDIREVGLFANGTDSANTGQLVARAVFNPPLTKTENNILNITSFDFILINPT